MLVAFFADVHGNAAALESLLAEIAARKPDRVVAAGDFVGLGPSPRRVLSLLAGRELDLIHGPDDAVLAIGIAKARPKNELPPWVHATRRMIDPGDFEAISESPQSQTIVAHDKKLWFTHGAAAEIRELARREAPEAEVVDAIVRAGLASAEVVAFGSRATPFTRVVTAGGVVRTIVGAGSVGRPTNGDPRPSFVLLRVEPDRTEIEVELVRVPYALSRTARSMRRRERSGVVSEEQALAFLDAQLSAATERDGAIDPNAAGTELLLALLAPNIRQVYLQAPRDWDDAGVEEIDALYRAAVRLREALELARPLLEDFQAERAIRRVRKLARALKRRRELDAAIRDLRAKEERLGERVKAAAVLRDLKRDQKRASKRLARRHARVKMLVHGLEVLSLAIDPIDVTTTFAALPRSSNP